MNLQSIYAYESNGSLISEEFDKEAALPLFLAKGLAAGKAALPAIKAKAGTLLGKGKAKAGTLLGKGKAAAGSIGAETADFVRQHPAITAGIGPTITAGIGGAAVGGVLGAGGARSLSRRRS